MEKDEIKLIAFYLPQFHINQLNNKLWGDGFTEWTNVAQGRPNFVGHYQPHIPGELGFYDLSFEENIKKQVGLAKEFGIYGFCFYYYWFDGKRALELPLDIFLNSNINFPFCICWANENWSKKWDGGNNDIVLEQSYSDNFEKKFIEAVAPILKDRRYIKIEDSPVLLIYRPTLFSNPKQSIKKMRLAAKEIGLDNVKILVVDFYIGPEKVAEMGADGIIEFPPHQFYDQGTLADFLPGKLLNSNFTGHVLDYKKMIERALHKWNTEDNYLYVRGIIPSWDNTARRKDSSVIVINNSPNLYNKWLEYLLKYSKNRGSPFIFINAWNEWGEGCHLEPDRIYGRAFLKATKDALNNYNDGLSLNESREKLRIELQQLAKVKQENSDENFRLINEISFKDFAKSKLFKYPKLFNFLRKIYKKLH